jgi:RNA polymerase sigma-70 factor, ECF subfamily
MYYLPGETAITDHEIITRIRSGQSDLYAELVRQYHKKVMGYCLTMLQNHTDAEEAAQDVFVKAYRSLDRFKEQSSFSTWLYRITANHCLDVLRKRNRRRTVSLDSLVENEGDRIHRLFSESPVAADLMENKDLVGKILSTLSEDYRTILTLREADGLEYQEIAEILECSLDAVKGRLSRARRQLQENLRHFARRKDVYYKEEGEK